MPSQATYISLPIAIIIAINAMIGAGIFTIPSELMAAVGPAGLISMLVVSCGVWFMAQAFAQLAKNNPQEGSLYTYAKSWGGRRIGELAAILYLCGMIVAMGLLCKYSGQNIHTLLPALPAQVASIGVLILVTLLTILGVHVSTLGQYMMLACTLFPLMSITLLCLLKVKLSNFQPFMPYGFASVLESTQIVIFNFFGFECAASLFKILKNPEKNIGKSFIVSISIVALIYMLFTGSMIGAFGAELATKNPTELLQQLYPQISSFVYILDISIISAIIGTVHAMLWSASYLFSFLIQESSNAGTTWLSKPQNNAALMALLISVPLLFINSLILFFNLTALVVVSAYILSMLALVVIPRQRSLVGIVGCSVGFCILAASIHGIITTLF